HIRTRRAPSPTLFPYTTLFRSSLATQLESRLKGGESFASLAKKYSKDPSSAKVGGKLTITKGQTVAPFDKVAFSLKTGETSPPVDRKSTRLNSSHVAISYAVFC